MKDTPLLFTPANAEKAHAGSKTQTRRLTGLEFVNASPERYRDPDAIKALATCPYGTIGDRMWVRERVQLHRVCEGAWVDVAYHHHVVIRYPWRDSVKPLTLLRATPCIHMPKWVCRTWLEVTEIRVERLQEISDEDAKAEGVGSVERFHLLWDEIRGDRAWELNPFVWVLSFRKVQP